MRTAVCPLRWIGATEASLNPGWLRARVATSPALTAAGVSAPPAFALSTVTELRLDVNVTFAPAPVRAQPSGTLIEKPAPGSLKRTNAVLSGMSPGGLFSLAFGLGADWADGFDEPQPVTATSAT